MTFLPQDYQGPQKGSGNYMKLIDGENRFRILSDAITGYEYWTTENKPVRSRISPAMPKDLRMNADGTPTKIKHFWAFVVWNYAASKAQILEITQKSVQDSIRTFVDNAKWGDPKTYDLAVKRSGEGFDTTYSVIAEPKSDLPEGALEQAKKINLLALFDGGDPFAPVDGPVPESDNLNLEDIPF